MSIQEQECCPRFDPAPWDDREFRWDNKKFVRNRVFTFFFVPVNFGQVIRRCMDLFAKAGAEAPDWLCLADHTSKWNMDIYVASDREIPGADNATISGTFLSKVYEGDFKETARWCKDFDAIVKSKGRKLKKEYMWYTTCPKCAKKFGKNYVVIVGEIE